MKKEQSPLIPIHVSIEEVKSLNYMQHGQFVDPESGLREYSRLLPLFEVPEVKDMFIEMAEHVLSHKELPEDVSRIEHELAATDSREDSYEEIPSDNDPEIKKLEALGEGKDKKIVLMPEPIVEFMDEISGRVSRDPVMGMQQFNAFEEILRGVSTITGAATGGSSRGEQGFARGGHVLGRPIVGKGKGQEDLIKDDRVREGSWIWDASATSDWGDGSTPAGQKELAKLEKFIAASVPDIKKVAARLSTIGEGDKAVAPRKPKIIPCALSDGERHTPTPIVTAAAIIKTGKPDNKKGAEVFREMTKKLRAHKNSNGTELPPPAPDIIKMFKEVG